MKILFISHDANRAGAQLFLLNIMRYFQKKIEMHLLLLDGGVLESDFKEVCNVLKYPQTSISNEDTISDKILRKLKLKNPKNQFDIVKETLKNQLSSEGFDVIYVNTIASAWVLPEILAYLHVPVVTHIHELEFSLQLYSTPTLRKFLFNHTTQLIACSEAVAKNIIDKHDFPSSKIEIIHSFVNNEEVIKRSQNTDKQAIRKKYHIPEKAFLVGGCGNAEWRKGVDIFASLAKSIRDMSSNNFYFAWVGVKKEGEYYEQVMYDIEKMGIKKDIVFIESTPEAIELINCFDIFTVVSREDPFPLVMLEAALSQRTILGFEGTGGCSEFIETDAGILFPYLNTHLMAQKIITISQNPVNEFGENAKEKVLQKYSFDHSIVKIEKLLTHYK